MLSQNKQENNHVQYWEESSLNFQGTYINLKRKIRNAKILKRLKVNKFIVVT